MKIGFRQRIKIAPGVTVNVGKTGGSVRLGPRGAGITTGTSGTRASATIPETGISLEHQISKPTARRGKAAAPDAPPNRAAALLVGAMILAIAAGLVWAVFAIAP